MDVLYSIALDGYGAVLATGFYEGTVDFDPSLNNASLTSYGGRDVFISKYDNNLNYQWAKQLGGIGTSEGRAIAIDAQNNIIASGIFNQIIDMDPDSTSLNLYSVTGAIDFYTAKFNTNGQLFWCKQGGGLLDDGAWTISASTPGVIHVGGYFRNSVNLDMPGSYYLSGYDGNPLIFQL